MKKRPLKILVAIRLHWSESLFTFELYTDRSRVGTNSLVDGDTICAHGIVPRKMKDVVRDVRFVVWWAPANAYRRWSLERLWHDENERA